MNFFSINKVWVVQITSSVTVLFPADRTLKFVFVLAFVLDQHVPVQVVPIAELAAALVATVNHNVFFSDVLNGETLVVKYLLT